ncbi:MAG: peptidoglycan glycosyltransferase [Cytophagales bacterium]|nr:peptidoglycan glycosyltransferase [Cytophagales bacterium]
MSSRSVVIKILIVLTGVGLSVRLFYIQLLDSDYERAAENNIVQKIIEYPYRGLLTDRNDSLLVYNTPVFDLMVIPNQVRIPDTTRFLQLLQISDTLFLERMNKAKHFSYKLASVLVNQLPNEHLAQIQGELIDYEGFFVQPRTVREYSYSGLAHTLGYVGEISLQDLKRDTTGYYRGGDYLGRSGIEQAYENDLRGERGVSYRMVDAQRVAKGKFREGTFDTLPEPGKDVQLTIDIELQQYAEKLMDGKVGSVVALDPKTGEILALVSGPDYDPSLLSGKKLSTNYKPLEEDSLKPLFNRALQAMYPPGSMFKTVQSLIALQQGIVTPTQKIFCEGDLIGDLAPPGKYDIKRGITYSSNNFFFIVFRRTMLQQKDPNMYLDSRIGLANWRDYVTQFGLGNRLGVDLPNEASGHVPTVDYYDKIYGIRRWKFSNIYSLSIGQGELLVSPLQMANLGALLGNRGHYFTPHLVKRIGNETSIEAERQDVEIDSVYFDSVLEGMEQVVTIGSGRRAYVNDLQICGKTSTVENPGYDHSGFLAFAPKDDPKIAIAVYVENAGWGGRAAAATAGLIIEKYLKGEVSRKYMEAYVLKGDFHD